MAFSALIEHTPSDNNFWKQFHI